MHAPHSLAPVTNLGTIASVHYSLFCPIAFFKKCCCIHLPYIYIFFYVTVGSAVKGHIEPTHSA